MRCAVARERRVAVIVNDMSEVNIDTQLVRDDGGELSRTEETLLELSNRCIFCTLRDELGKDVRQLAAEAHFDFLLIESTSIWQPMPVAATFAVRDQISFSLADVARLDTMVIVVDCESFVCDFSASERLRARARAWLGRSPTGADPNAAAERHARGRAIEARTASALATLAACLPSLATELRPILAFEVKGFT